MKKFLSTLTIILSILTAYTLYSYHMNVIAQGGYVDLTFIFTIELLLIAGVTAITLLFISTSEAEWLS